MNNSGTKFGIRYLYPADFAIDSLRLCSVFTINGTCSFQLLFAEKKSIDNAVTLRHRGWHSAAFQFKYIAYHVMFTGLQDAGFGTCTDYRVNFIRGNLIVTFG
jgi:hypothetical protein